MNIRLAKAQFAAWLGIAANLLLAMGKFAAGLIADSRALIADAVNSASDVVGSVAVLIGLRSAERPPDREHPYGHGKAESVASIIVSVLLFLAGFEIARSSFTALFRPIEAPGALAVYTAIASIAIKEALFRYQRNLGKRINSPSLVANAWDHRSDVLATAAALAGIGGALLSKPLGFAWLIYLDPVAGILVSLLVLRVAYHMMRGAIQSTLDRVLPPEEIAPFVRTVESVPGVLHIDDFRAREHGHYLIVDVKVGVDPHITVEQGHLIGKQVKLALLNRHEQIRDVFVHINPFHTAFPLPAVSEERDRGERDTLH